MQLGIFNNLDWWQHHVQERITTAPKDRFHALEGVLGHLRSLFGDHEFVWVLPNYGVHSAMLQLKARPG